MFSFFNYLNQVAWVLISNIYELIFFILSAEACQTSKRGFFCQNSNFFHKDLHLRYFSGFYMRLWSPLFLVNFYCRLGSFFSKVTLIIHAQCVWVRFPIRTFETISTATNLSSKMHSRGMADLHNKNVSCLKKIWYSVLKCRSSNTL